MAQRFLTNVDRLTWLHSVLEEPYTRTHEEKRAAKKQAWEWIKSGVFGFNEFEDVLDAMHAQGYAAAEEDAADLDERMTLE